MSRGREPRESTEPFRARIEVLGSMGNGMARWLEATPVEVDGRITVLEVQVVDQSELFGRLQRIHDLNLTLVSFRRIDHRDSSRSQSCGA